MPRTSMTFVVVLTPNGMYHIFGPNTLREQRRAHFHINSIRSFARTLPPGTYSFTFTGIFFGLFSSYTYMRLM